MFGQTGVYCNVFDKVTEQVGKIGVRVTFQNGATTFLTILGGYEATQTEKSRLDSQYYPVEFKFTTARENLENLISSNPDWIVDDNDIYYNTKTNPILSVAVVEDTPYNVTVQKFVGYSRNTGE